MKTDTVALLGALTPEGLKRLKDVAAALANLADDGTRELVIALAARSDRGEAKTRKAAGKRGPRSCGKCGKAGHDARNCAVSQAKAKVKAPAKAAAKSTKPRKSKSKPNGKAETPVAEVAEQHGQPV